jgi:hypothetical protein
MISIIEGKAKSIDFELIKAPYPTILKPGQIFLRQRAPKGSLRKRRSEGQGFSIMRRINWGMKNRSGRTPWKVTRRPSVTSRLTTLLPCMIYSVDKIGEFNL